MKSHFYTASFENVAFSTARDLLQISITDAVSNDEWAACLKGFCLSQSNITTEVNEEIVQVKIGKPSSISGIGNTLSMIPVNASSPAWTSTYNRYDKFLATFTETYFVYNWNIRNSLKICLNDSLRIWRITPTQPNLTISLTSAPSVELNISATAFLELQMFE